MNSREQAAGALNPTTVNNLDQSLHPAEPHELAELSVKKKTLDEYIQLISKTLLTDFISLSISLPGRLHELSNEVAIDKDNNVLHLMLATAGLFVSKQLLGAYIFEPLMARIIKNFVYKYYEITGSSQVQTKGEVQKQLESINKITSIFTTALQGPSSYLKFFTFVSLVDMNARNIGKINLLMNGLQIQALVDVFTNFFTIFYNHYQKMQIGEKVKKKKFPIEAILADYPYCQLKMIIGSSMESSVFNVSNQYKENLISRKAFLLAIKNALIKNGINAELSYSKQLIIPANHDDIDEAKVTQIKADIKEELEKLSRDKQIRIQLEQVSALVGAGGYVLPSKNGIKYCIPFSPEKKNVLNEDMLKYTFQDCNVDKSETGFVVTANRYASKKGFAVLCDQIKQNSNSLSNPNVSSTSSSAQTANLTQTTTALATQVLFNGNGTPVAKAAAKKTAKSATPKTAPTPKSAKAASPKATQNAKAAKAAAPKQVANQNAAKVTAPKSAAVSTNRIPTWTLPDGTKLSFDPQNCNPQNRIKKKTVVELSGQGFPKGKAYQYCAIDLEDVTKLGFDLEDYRHLKNKIEEGNIAVGRQGAQGTIFINHGFWGENKQGENFVATAKVKLKGERLGDLQGIAMEIKADNGPEILYYYCQAIHNVHKLMNRR